MRNLAVDGHQRLRVTARDATLALIVLAAITLSLDRFPQWDEGVFLSQTSGRDGAEAPAAFLGPSREIGTVWYVAMITRVSANYPNLRLLHIALTLLVLLLAASKLKHTLPTPPWAIVLVLGSYWVTFAYLGQFLRFALLTFVLLSALGQYLMLLSTDRPGRRDAVILGLFCSVALLMGPFEAGTVVTVVVLHWAWRFRSRLASSELVPFAITVGVAFGITFLLESRARFGSVRERIATLTGRDSPLNTSALDWAQFGEYLRLIAVEPVSNLAYAPTSLVARSAWWVAGVVLAIGAASAIRGAVRALRGRDVPAYVTLFGSCFLLLMLFLAGFYDAMSDRYFILPGSLLLLLGLSSITSAASKIFAGADDAVREPGDPNVARVLVVVTVAFMVTNIAAAGELDEGWAGNRHAAAALDLTRIAVGEEPCSGVARYNIPSVQWATGCEISQRRTFEAALEWAETEPAERHVFIYWPTRLIPDELFSEVQDRGWRELLQHPSNDPPPNQVFFRP